MRLSCTSLALLLTLAIPVVAHANPITSQFSLTYDGRPPTVDLRASPKRAVMSDLEAISGLQDDRCAVSCTRAPSTFQGYSG